MSYAGWVPSRPAGSFHTADIIQKLKAELTRGDFEKRFTHPWLIRHLDADERPPSTFNTVAWDTKPVSGGKVPGNVLLSARLRGDPSRYGLHPVIKQAKVWSDQILVGRALNNDIIFRHESVSKLHAYFKQRRDGVWLLYDAKSANGTTVDGQKIPAGEGLEVRSGVVLIFGHLPIELIESGDLWDSL
jgi:FHA domain-containing protein